MKRTLCKLSQLLFVAGLLALTPTALEAQTANPNPPPFMTYQGYLTDGNGVALATNAPKNYDVVFRIYTASTGGNEVWGEEQTVTVDKGYFSVLLAEGSQYNGELHGPLSSLFATNDASDRYIEMTVKGIGSGGSDTTILPRLRLMTSPYSFLAQNAINASALVNNSNTPIVTANGTSLSVAGSVTANTFYGNGANLTSVNGANLQNGTVSASKFTSDIGVWTRSSPNVSSYSGSLYLNGANIFMDNGYTLSAKNTSGTYEQWMWPRWNDNATYLNFGNNGFHIRNNGSGDVMFMNGNGGVGIGTTSPAAPLHVFSTGWPTEIIDGSNPAGTWMDLRNTTAGGTNWDIISTGNGNGEGPGKLLFRPGTAPGTVTGIAPLTLTPDGNVGIGTYNPTKAALEVDGWQYNTMSDYTYLHDNSSNPSGFNSGSGGSQPYSIYAAYRVAASEFNAFSDARIKNIKGQSDGQKDLGTLMKIKVTDYTMRDTVAHGARPIKKVIGQQVESVYPQAVTRTTDVVPDIYTKTEAKAGWIALSKQLKPALKVGDKVQLITDAKKDIYEVTEVKPGGFRVKESLTGSVFVYGRQVNDFRTVDYNAIAMLNVSATQELYRELHEKTAEIAAMKEKLSAVESMQKELAGLKKQLATQEADRNARLEALERQLHAQQAQDGVRSVNYVRNDQ